MRSGNVVRQDEFFFGKLTWQVLFDCFSKDSTVRSRIYRSAFEHKLCMTTPSLSKTRVSITFPDEVNHFGLFLFLKNFNISIPLSLFWIQIANDETKFRFL